MPQATELTSEEIYRIETLLLNHLGEDPSITLEKLHEVAIAVGFSIVKPLERALGGPVLDVIDRC